MITFSDCEADESMADSLRIVRAEFLDMPGLTLTKPQVRRLCNLDAALCDRVLDMLETTRFLERTARDCYALARG
jgi:hypothetical protein